MTTRTSTPVRSTVDLGTRGRVTGHLLVDPTDDAHAYSLLTVPVAVVGGRPGPTALLVAGTHGDEWEGQVILRQLVADLDPDDVHGRLIVLPSFNLPAVRASRRCSPIDGRNMNRAFPGDPGGGPTDVLAHFVEHELLPRCTYAVDLHSGGSASQYLPSGFLRIDDDPHRTKEKVAAAEALALPYTLVVADAGEARTLSAAADRQGAVMVATELGGAGRLDGAVLALARGAVRRLLGHWGLLALPPRTQTGPELRAARSTRFLALQADRAAVVSAAGILEPAAGLGVHVERGAVVARVHPLEEISRPSVDVVAPSAGVVAVVRSRPLVAPGDVAATIGLLTASSDIVSDLGITAGQADPEQPRRQPEREGKEQP